MRPGIPGDSGTAKLSGALVSSFTPDPTFADRQGENMEGDFVIN